jgi:predicted molibdopterin-dependent oxidoreductase YjgC
MFKRLPDSARREVSITVDGKPVAAREGDSVAAALLGSGSLACRTTPVSGAPRAPYCMMGVCFDCLVTVDGTANVQGCMARVRDGMRIEIQAGKRRLDP